MNGYDEYNWNDLRKVNRFMIVRKGVVLARDLGRESIAPAIQDLLTGGCLTANDVDSFEVYQEVRFACKVKAVYKVEEIRQ